MLSKICPILLLLAFMLIFLPNKVFAVISFSISNTQYQNDEINVDVSLSGLTSSSCPTGSCYLQGAFTAQSGNPRYFGFTKNHLGEFYEYDGTPDTTYIKSTFFAFPFQASWSGKLILKSNPNHPDYKGPGQYNLKVWRYTGNSSSPAGDPSNVLSVDITGPTPTFTPTPTSKSTNSPAPTKSPSLTKTPAPPKSPSPELNSAKATPKALTPAPILLDNEKLEKEVLGEASESATLSPSSSPSASKNPKRKEIVLSSRENNIAKILIALGFVFILACGILFSWPHIKKKLKKDE